MRQTICLLFSLALCAFAGAEAPERLSQTGLYSDIAAKAIAPGNMYFEPQYPLWSDGAEKSRWISLPPGTRIDTTDLDRWIFPVGTRFWKEFSFARPDGRGSKRVETRFLEKDADGTWIFATYYWNEDETEATRAPVNGIQNVFPTSTTTSHDVPALSSCQFCHHRGGDPILGFDVLQLSDDRDPLALHRHFPPKPGLTLRKLFLQDRLSSLPTVYLLFPPRIQARTAEGRAAMGYLHGNCGSCHNPEGRAGFTGQFLRHAVSAADEKDEPAFATTVDQLTNGYQIPGQTETYRIHSGDPQGSAIHYRLAITGRGQMPPIARKLVDTEAVEELTRWIKSLGR